VPAAGGRELIGDGSIWQWPGVAAMPLTTIPWHLVRTSTLHELVEDITEPDVFCTWRHPSPSTLHAPIQLAKKIKELKVMFVNLYARLPQSDRVLFACLWRF